MSAYFKNFAIDWKKLLENKEPERILANEKSTLKKEKKKKKLRKNKERILAPFTSDDFYKLVDPYKRVHEDPEFNKPAINNMFDFQKGYEADRHQGYVNFSKNQLHYLDTGLNFDHGVPDTLFRTTSSEVVDLDKFETEVRARGASFGKHIETTNIGEPIKELIIHLKQKTKFKIFYEKLDPTLLDQINEIGNNDIKHFHRDNYLNYNDFSAELKRNEIFARVPQ